MLLLSGMGTTALAQLPAYNQTVSSLWNEYVSNPNNHPNIPNNSYAGYGTGTIPIPAPSTTPINVTTAPFKAIPNDNLNDQPAIQAAIDAAGTAGGGIVYLPAGTYRLDKALYIKYSNVIVRGQASSGSTATILDFKFSMYSMYKADIDASGNKGALWWSTGLVWMGPTDLFKSNGAPNMAGGFEDWKYTSTLATVTQMSNPGTFSITVDNAASLSAGMKVVLCYRMPTDRSLLKHIYGHAPTMSAIDNNTYVGDCSTVKSPVAPYYYYPALIQSISGNTVTFDRPLRIKVDPTLWPATIRNIKAIVTESGLENVQIKGYNTSKMGHLVTPTSTTTAGSPTLGGWNGLYFNRSWNCWANNIRFVNLECGVIFASAKNCSALNTFITSTSYDHWYHHPYTFRSYSSDNLVENFTIDGPSSVRHGISTEGFSSGNVYSKGLMKAGTFDTHRGSPFDLIKTEITVANDAGSSQGGASTAGPYTGKRNVNWNIIQKIQSGYVYENATSRKGDNIYEPLQYSMGAFVGITGSIDSSRGETMPPPPSGSDLGSRVVTASITDSSLSNLYRAELALRKKTGTNIPPAINITSPATNTSYEAPADITINATASDADGTISKVEFYNGNTFLGSDNGSPYSYNWNNVEAGNYTITARAYDNSGAYTISSSVVVVVHANAAPSISITSPATNASYEAPADITINATASDADGTISKVEFYNGNTLLGSDNSSPYSFSWNNVAADSYTITAKAYDNSGAYTVSSPVAVVVWTIIITSPVTNTSYEAPADITITATASDPDGSISKVEFYDGSTLLCTDRSDPYNCSLNNLEAGSYTLTAKAFYKNGNIATSEPVTISVMTVAARSLMRADKEDKSISPQEPLSLNVNPNPVAGLLNISINGFTANSRPAISILSVSGAVIKTIQPGVLNKNVQFDVSSLSGGVYFIKVINGNRVLYKQFVKL